MTIPPSTKNQTHQKESKVNDKRLDRTYLKICTTSPPFHASFDVILWATQRHLSSLTVLSFDINCNFKVLVPETIHIKTRLMYTVNEELLGMGCNFKLDSCFLHTSYSLTLRK